MNVGRTVPLRQATLLKPMLLLAATFLCLTQGWGAQQALAQGNAFAQGFGFGRNTNNQGLQGGPNNQGLQQGNNQQPGNGLPGGSPTADFDSLIDLITSTILPDSWVDNGGTADIRPFAGGVWIDSAGVLRQPDQRPPIELTSLTVPPAPTKANQPIHANPRSRAKLRCVSLPRLEAEMLRRMRTGEPLDESMLTLAGLQRVEYLFLYPETGDLVLAGPAGDWQVDPAGRIVSTDNQAPVVRLDDLLTLLRRERRSPGKPLGCSITPRQESLALTQQFLQKSSTKPLRPGRAAREKWLETIRSTLGRQDIEVFGLDPSTHVAKVLVEADHHMKRIGIGLEEGVVGVDSYLDTVVENQKGEQPLSVLRWWFATNYQGIQRNQAGTAIAIVGQAVQVLSENELLTKRGERIHTGQADAATQQFAQQFTQQFAPLCRKYPVYGELRNLFDLAIVASLLETEDLYTTAGWQPLLLLDAEHLPLPKYRTPKEVDTLLNHRLVDKTKILAAVSGGVWIDTPALLAERQKLSPELAERIEYQQKQTPVDMQAGEWWWDLE